MEEQNRVQNQQELGSEQPKWITGTEVAETLMELALKTCIAQGTGFIDLKGKTA